MSPRLPDRLLRDGARSLSDAELVAVLLHSSCRTVSAERLADGLLEDLGGLAGLGQVDDQVLDRRDIGPIRASILLAVRELSARFGRAELLGRQVLDHPAAIATYVTLRFCSTDQEVLGVLFLDGRNQLIVDEELFRGTQSRIAVEPRQILRAALRHRAASMVLFHTHPTGDPAPSAEDQAFTDRIDRAGRLVGVRLADHLVVGGMGRWVSMKRRGDL